MASFSYKTRGNSSPQGKPKVYFACHPDDFSLFEAISNEILAEVNCTVFYASEPVTDVEAHLRDLLEMNLIVIPVTARFLTEHSIARDNEFLFSQQNHVPVLPLVQESGLADLFNKVLGDIQFLDKTARDDTAISYEDKFKSFLSSILVGDELADKIRQAFDAYIFLSYRKKDRAYAQELMRLIHENEFCRDVAIWYDEFLVPGENFNDTIADALQKSKLFALAVTPDLVNETNYVMTTEYPMAKKAGKKILAAELVPTDREALESHYADLPENIDAHDPKSLADALFNALDGIALRKSDIDPRHNFFIGLAYLSGIDVEKNPVRALSLITSAAKEGLPEAMEKLVTMYRSGEGIRRDHEKAILWQEKLVEIYRDRYNKTDGETDAQRYLRAIQALGDDYQALGKLAKAESVYEAMRTETDRVATIHSWLWLTRCSFICNNSLGDIAKLNGNLPLAREYYSKALELVKAAVKETDPIDSQRGIAVCYVRLGDIAYINDDLNSAFAYFSESLEIREAIAKESGTIEAKRDLAACYERLGDVAKANRNPASALEYYSRSLDVAEAIVKETGTLKARRDLAVCYHRLGSIVEETGDLHLTREYYAKALGIYEAIANETETVQARHDLSQCCIYLGDIAQTSGDLTLALDYYLKSLAMTEAVAKEIGTVDARRALSLCYDRLGSIAELNGDLPSAFDYYSKTLAICEAIAKEVGTVRARRDLAISYERLGIIAELNGDLAASFAYFSKSLPVFEALASESGTNLAYDNLAVTHYNFAKLFRRLSDLDSAAFHAQEAFSIWQTLAKRHPQIPTFAERRDNAKYLLDLLA